MGQHNRDTLENPLEILLNDGAAGCNRDPSRRSYLYNCTSFTAADDDYYPIRGNLRSSIVGSIVGYAFFFSAATSIFVEYPISLSWLI